MGNMENHNNKESKKTIPDEIKGWNWGAFFLHFIWGIGNRTYIGLLGLVPFVNIIIMPVLGLKGNEWAWRNREWESVEEFRRVQKKWNLAGLIATTIYLLLFVKGLVEIILG